MDLDEFVETVLGSVLTGIRNAQSVEGVGAFVVPSMIGGHDYAKHPRVSLKGHLSSTIIDFDIALTVEESSSKAGSGGIKVAGFGGSMEGASATKDTRASRIQFAVPILLPESAQSWSDALRDEG